MSMKKLHMRYCNKIMTKQENILVTIMEECVEVQQAISKVLRFGYNNYHPSKPGTENWYTVLEEYYQLIAAVDFAQSQMILPQLGDNECNLIKMEKVAKMEKWLKVSEYEGTIQ